MALGSSIARARRMALTACVACVSVMLALRIGAADSPPVRLTDVEFWALIDSSDADVTRRHRRWRRALSHGDASAEDARGTAACDGDPPPPPP